MIKEQDIYQQTLQLHRREAYNETQRERESEREGAGGLSARNTFTLKH